MRAITVLVLAAICWLIPVDIDAAVRVRGYTRKDGTYVAPHYRSAPDGNFYNNWSTKGNVNPYTGKAGTRVTPPPGYGRGTYVPDVPRFDYSPTLTTPIAPGTSPSPYRLAAEKRDRERADYWNARGYAFDPTIMSASAMDRKVTDIERAKFWKAKSYDFNPDYMSAASMDRKVQDINRSNHWRERGYDFNADYMSAASMDRKVIDIERAKYWKQRGFDFNAAYLSAASMDREAEKLLRTKRDQIRAPKIVEIKGFGQLEFPSDATDAEIKEVLDQELPRIQKEIAERTKLRK